MSLNKIWLKLIADYDKQCLGREMIFWNICRKCGYLHAVKALSFIHVMCVSEHQEKKKLDNFE